MGALPPLRAAAWSLSLAVPAAGPGRDVEPLKLAALVVAGEGHWLSGTATIIAAYAVSLLFVERLFRLVKPKLLMLGWFAALWSMVVSIRGRFASDRPK